MPEKDKNEVPESPPGAPDRTPVKEPRPKKVPLGDPKPDPRKKKL